MVGMVVFAAVSLALPTACGSSGGGSGATTGAASSAGAAASESSASSAAPSSAASGEWPNTTLNPCEMLTTAEVAKVVAMKVDDGKVDNGTPGSRGCLWNTAAGDSGQGLTVVDAVTLEVSGPNPALKSRYPDASSYFDSLKQVYANDLQPVTGIGEQAFITHNQHWIWAIQGKVVLRVFITGGPPSTVVPELKALMTQALTKA